MCSEEDIFTDKIETIIYNGGANTVRKYLIPKGIGTVIWYWTDDNGELHTNTLNNLIYFTDSPFKRLSATALAKSMKDYEVTWVLTKSKYYTLIRYCGNYRKKISNS